MSWLPRSLSDRPVDCPTVRLLAPPVLPLGNLTRLHLNKRLPNLDLLRGLAALLVCAGHLRSFLLVDFGALKSPGLFDRLFYFSTGLGHQAVVIFFVLSGYLVGGSVLTAYDSGRWSWFGYASRRLSRLWVVLLPALLLTFILDSLGRHWSRPGYDGILRAIYHSGPTATAPADLRLATFLGNAFFLQTIRVNCFGTNGPLWSLANEFWYYTLFPLAFGAIVGRNQWNRIACATLAALLIWWLPGGLLGAGLIWLMGVAAFWFCRLLSVQRVCRAPWLLITGVLLSLGTLLASKTDSILGSDWSIGAAFALLVVGLSIAGNPVPSLRRAFTGLSEISYTLYLVHFPVLALLFYSSLAGRRFQVNLGAYLLFGTLLVLTVTFAAGFWWCFERNTDRVRRSLESLASRAYGGVPASSVSA